MEKHFSNPAGSLPGPLFEPGPGWGKILSLWLKNNFYHKILPALAILIFLTGFARFYGWPHSSSDSSESPSPSAALEQDSIAIKLNAGEGVITASRQALAQYLKEFPEIKLAPEERLSIDNFFSTKMMDHKLTVGQELLFLKADLTQAVNEALALPPAKRQKLKAYLP